MGAAVVTAQQLTLEGFAVPPLRRFWVVTLSGIRNRGTFGPFATERAADEWAAKHGRATSNFVIPVKPPSAMDGARDA